MEITKIRMDLIAIGKISKPIGTRGEVKILPLTEDTHRFINLPAAWVGRDAVHAEVKNILKMRIDTKHVALFFEGIETIEESEKLKDSYLFVRKEDAIKLQTGHYFVDDVIGCEVVTEEQEGVGVITDLLSLQMNDVWVVKEKTKEILLPAVKAVIRKVDLENRRITIHTIDGLLD